MNKLSSEQWRRLGLLLGAGAAAVGAVAAVAQIVQSLTAASVMTLVIAAAVVAFVCVLAGVAVLWWEKLAKVAMSVAMTVALLFFATAAAFVLGALVQQPTTAGPLVMTRPTVSSSAGGTTTSTTFTPPTTGGATNVIAPPPVTPTTTTTVAQSAFSIDEVTEVPFCSTFSGRGVSPTGHAGVFVQYAAPGMPFIFEQLVDFPNPDRWRTRAPVHIGDQNGGDNGKTINVFVVALTADQAAAIPGGSDSFDALPGPQLASTFVRRVSGNGTC